jgi:hypothetical protein
MEAYLMHSFHYHLYISNSSRSGKTSWNLWAFVIPESKTSITNYVENQDGRLKASNTFQILHNLKANNQETDFQWGGWLRKCTEIQYWTGNDLKR